VVPRTTTSARELVSDSKFGFPTLGLLVPESGDS
jgi:hypothetical protein